MCHHKAIIRQLRYQDDRDFLSKAMMARHYIKTFPRVELISINREANSEARNMVKRLVNII